MSEAVMDAFPNLSQAAIEEAKRRGLEEGGKVESDEQLEQVLDGLIRELESEQQARQEAVPMDPEIEAIMGQIRGTA